MSRPRERVDLGEPALRIAGFQLWVHSEPGSCSAAEPYDGWLRVTAHCGAAGASVWTDGEILLLSEIAGFGERCAALARGERTKAALDPIERWLNLNLETVDASGQLRLRVEITPDLGRQEHSFDFEVDPTVLPGIVRACAAIVAQMSAPRPDSDARG